MDIDSANISWLFQFVYCRKPWIQLIWATKWSLSYRLGGQYENYVNDVLLYVLFGVLFAKTVPSFSYAS